MSVVDVIAAKRDGQEIEEAALRELVLGYARDEVPDYQMAAFLMAGRLRGFDDREAAVLTQAMLDSGDRMDLSGLRGPTIDKHSTGGVADGTTLVVAPLAAVLGMQVLKLSGRGLGHTGGTLDKLEAIPGMRVALSTTELMDQVERIGVAVGAQTGDLVPADRKMYALRDVTATVDEPALIASSVMSKKLAGGATHILLDVKTGAGAFMVDPDDARHLAELCVRIGEHAGRRTAALITDMSQPLGAWVGNAVEIVEAVEVLRGERTGRFADLCLELTGHLAALAELAPDAEHGVTLARRAMESGAGLERFREFVEAQGGDPRVVEDLSRLPQAPVDSEVHLDLGREGFITAIDPVAIGRAAAGLGAGRERIEDQIDPAVGIELLVEVGDEVKPGEPVMRILARSDDALAAASRQVGAALTVGAERPSPPTLVQHVIGPADAR
ncbi:MAG TPA: thymidine phosphorylase [Solirubrobacteraceae bacterium]|nr:thymidine phosphorylase [Solirubrobacteraceae bacterium]